MDRQTSIEEIGSAGISAFAAEFGIESMEFLGEGGPEDGSWRISLYGYELDGRPYRVQVTNADPVWEESDPEGFAANLAEAGLA